MRFSREFYKRVLINMRIASYTLCSRKCIHISSLKLIVFKMIIRADEQYESPVKWCVLVFSFNSRYICPY